MRCPPSSGNSRISPWFFPWSVAASGCANGTAASDLGDGAGVRSRSPLAGVRSAGLEAGTVTQAQSLASFGSDRSCLQFRSAGSSRSVSQPCCHATSCRINSYPVGARSGRTINPHTWGSGLGKRGHSFFAEPAPGLVSGRHLSARRGCGPVPWTSAGLIRPDRTSLSLSSHGAVLLRHPARHLVYAACRSLPSQDARLRSNFTPSIRSVFARRLRCGPRIEAGSTAWLSTACASSQRAARTRPDPPRRC